MAGEPRTATGRKVVTMYGGLIDDVLGIEAEAASPSTPGLDAAWTAAEAALPDGWTMLVGRERVVPYSYWATASSPRGESNGYRIVSTSRDGTLEPTPAAALLALAKRLSQEPET